MPTGPRKARPDDRLRIEPQMCNCTSGNLEIPRCAIAHLRSGPSDHPGMTIDFASPRNHDRCRTANPIKSPQISQLLPSGPHSLYTLCIAKAGIAMDRIRIVGGSKLNGT